MNIVRNDSDLRYVEFPEAQHEALRGFHQALRRVLANHAIVNPEEDRLHAMTEQLNAIADELDALPKGRPFQRFVKGIPEDNPNRALPFSPISGYYSAVSMPMKIAVEGKRIVGEGVFNEVYEGPNGCIHGGMIAAIYDEILAMANVISDVAGPTVALTVNYKRPTPLHQPLRFEGWTESSEGRKTITKGRCLLNGEVISEAEGVFIRLDPTRAYPQWTNTKATTPAE